MEPINHLPETIMTRLLGWIEAVLEIFCSCHVSHRWEVIYLELQVTARSEENWPCPRESEPNMLRTEPFRAGIEHTFEVQKL